MEEIPTQLFWSCFRCILQNYMYKNVLKHLKRNATFYNILVSQSNISSVIDIFCQATVFKTLYD